MIVVGGGVIGLAIAWRVAATGSRVAIVDPSPGQGASWAAAGMLAPVSEVHRGEEKLLRLNMASARLWESFAHDLVGAAGFDVGYRTTGTLVVALDEGDRAWARELFEFQVELGLDVRWMLPSALRHEEPNLAPGVRGGMLASGDHQVDNRLLVRALVEATRRSGCCFHRTTATSIEAAGGTVEGVRLAQDVLLEAPVVVLAAGAWSGLMGGLPDGAAPAVRPVKGQIIRLSAPPEPALLRRPVRGIAKGTAVYLVPRADGTIVVGSTFEEKGFDTTVTAGAVYELLRDAHRVAPGVAEMQLVETMARLRPGSPDNAPIVGEPRSPSVSGLIVATGHFRNGVLLTPITAHAVAALVGGGEVPEEIATFSPSRSQVSSWST